MDTPSRPDLSETAPGGDTVPRGNTAPGIEAAITCVKAGRVSGWVTGADRRRLLALYVGRRRIATTSQTKTDNKARAEFSFDARECPPDLLLRPKLVLDVAILGDVGIRIASTEVASDSFLMLKDLAPAPGGALHGCIDQNGDGLLRGWVHEPARPERRLELFVFSTTRYLGKYVADQPRPDLASLGHGDGHYGFEIPFPAGAKTVVVIAGDPEYWPIPSGAHAVSEGATRTSKPAASVIEAFARALTTTEPFPKKAFVIDKIKHGMVPDAFAADYVVLALECLRHEMVATGETMESRRVGGSWRTRLKGWIDMRVIGMRIRRLEELAVAITATPRLLQAAAKHRKSEAAKMENAEPHAIKSDAIKSDMIKSDVIISDVAESNVAKSDIPKPDVAHKVSIDGLTQS